MMYIVIYGRILRKPKQANRQQIKLTESEQSLNSVNAIHLLAGPLRMAERMSYSFFSGSTAHVEILQDPKQCVESPGPPSAPAPRPLHAPTPPENTLLKEACPSHLYFASFSRLLLPSPCSLFSPKSNVSCSLTAPENQNLLYICLCST